MSITHAKDLKIDHPNKKLGNDKNIDDNNKDIYEIYDDSDLNVDNNKETNVVSDSD